MHAATLLAISIYAYAFSAGGQVATRHLPLGPLLPQELQLSICAVPVMPGDALPLASYAPPVGPFEQEVTSLEKRRTEFSERPIIFYGSSSIRRWKSLSEDFTGYPVVTCGFGGSRLSDCVRYVSRLVLRFKPAAVAVYAGDNDLAQGALPDQADQTISLTLPFSFQDQIHLSDLGYQMLRRDVSSFLASEEEGEAALGHDGDFPGPGF